MLTNLIIGVLASGDGGGTLLDVNPGLIFWTAITFIILVLVLKRVAWKPILTALDNRAKGIEDSLNRAEQAKEEAQKILEENQATLSKAEEESKKIIDQSRIYADNLKEQMLKESKDQQQKIIEEQQLKIDSLSNSVNNYVSMKEYLELKAELKKMKSYIYQSTEK